MYVSIHPRGRRNEFDLVWRRGKFPVYRPYELAFGVVAYECGMTRAEAIGLLRLNGYTRAEAEQYLREERARSKAHYEAYGPEG